MSKSEFISVGKIAGLHGVRGELKMHAYSPAEELSELLKERFKSVEINGKNYDVEASRFHSGKVLLKLKKVTTFEEAEPLKGSEVGINRDELPELAEGEYYHFDLIGMEVLDEGGEALGVLKEIISVGSNDVYQIEGAGGETLLPALSNIILDVDLTARRMKVKLPEGIGPEEKK